jgi:MFS family permease
MLGKKYILTAACVYLAYFCHGMMAIAITQNATPLMAQWGTDLAGILTIVGWTGLGKFLCVWICGEISDRIGRRWMMVLGGVGYVAFFIGLMYTHSYGMACFFAFLGGAVTECFDGGGYPAIQESFPKAPGAALVWIKGFIAISGTIYPFIVAQLAGTSMWTALLWVPGILSIGVVILAFVAPFSYDANLKEERAAKLAGKAKADPATEAAKARIVNKPSFAVEGVICLAYGFIAMMTFYLIQQCIAIYGQGVLHMSPTAAHLLTSYYTIGGFSAVIIGSIILARGVRTLTLLLFYTAGSLISMLAMCFIQTPVVTGITSFTVGFCAAGGALQLGVALIGEYFPAKKGRNLGIYYTFMGFASYVGPLIAGKLVSMSTEGLEKGTEAYMAAQALGKVHIMYFDLFIALIGFVMMLILVLRYKYIFGVSPFTLNK